MDARPLWGDVDLGAIAHNLTLVRARAGRPVRVIVPVKADAYGHGAEAVGRHLERLGVDGLATANVAEAVALRGAGVELPIVMYGSHLPAGAGYLLAHGLTPTIYGRPALEAVAGAADGGPVGVHVKVDAGFGRLGVRLDEAADLVRAVVAEPRLRLEGLYTHVPFDDPVRAPWAVRCLEAFRALVRAVEAEHGLEIPYAQAGASSVLTLGLADALNTIAPGHLLYGLCPITGRRAEELGLRKALRSLRAGLIHVAGPSASRTGVILFGIDNGYGRSGGTAVVVCRGVRCPVLSVTAEYTVLDLSAVAGAAIGDEVTIVGEQDGEAIAVEDVAAATGAPSAGYWMMGLRKVPLRYSGM